jgi:hypothetical protein
MPFGKSKVLLRGKCSVGAELPGHAPELFRMPCEKMLITITVGRIATFDYTIQYQCGGAARQKYLMAVLGITTTLDDDVGMLFKKGNDLLRCGNLRL